MKADQDRVKALLAESITVLCKNGLSYKNRFTIQGLLGITLDDEEVFLIDIHEKIGERHPIATWSAKERDFDGQKPQRNVPASSSPEPPIKRKRRHSESRRSVSPTFDTSHADRNTVRQSSNIESRVTEGGQGDDPSHTTTFQPFTEPLPLSQSGTAIPSTSRSLSEGKADSSRTDSSVRLPGEECALEMSVDDLRGDIEQSIQDLNDLVSQSQTSVTETPSRTERLPKRLDSGSSIKVKTEKLDDIFIVKEESSGSDSHLATDTGQSGQFAYETAQPGCSSWNPQDDNEFPPDYSIEQAGELEETDEDHTGNSEGLSTYRFMGRGALDILDTLGKKTRKRRRKDGSWTEHWMKHASSSFPCTVCGKTFPFLSKLRRHMLFHSGLRQHVCEICGKGYFQASDLTKHKKKCVIKNKTFL